MSAVLEAQVLGIGLLGPGLADWAGSAALLQDPARYLRQPTVVPPPQRLPANERRRAGTVIKASLAVADQAVAMAGADPARLATVFTSSTGDPANCHALCEALAAPERLVSPTRFTNSVHNAAAGYWHIATHSMCASTSLAAFDASFGAGLLEAAVSCHAAQAPVLLVACDVPYPEPLHALRPVADTLAVALLLAPVTAGAASAPGPRLQLALTGSAADTACRHVELEALRTQIPAARALPLLEALAGARGLRPTLTLQAVDGLALQVDLQLDPKAAAPLGAAPPATPANP